MLSSRKPFTSESFVLFPQGARQRVVDFWSQCFVYSSGEQNYSQEEINSLILSELSELGYTYSKDRVVFSTGVVGVGRDIGIFGNSRAIAMICIQPQSGGLCYVSLRTVYTEALSWIRVIWFLLRAVILADLLWVSQSSFLDYYGLSDTDIFFEFFKAYFTNMGLYEIQYLLIACIILGLTLSIRSWFRTGYPWSFLMEDFNEWHRDDIASVGNIAYVAIHRVADAISMEAILPSSEVASPPAFGASIASAQSHRRAPRL